MKKSILIVISLAVIIIALGAVLAFLPSKQPENNQPEVKGIKIDSLSENQKISSPLKITGTTNGDGWNGFEGQVGTVKLLDYKGNQLALGILTATTDWMNPPVKFETVLNFSSDIEQPGTLVFMNENASGMPEKNKTYTLPVTIQKTGETVAVKAFFNNSKLDPEYSCNKVFPVERRIPKTTAVARAAIQELLNGVTLSEQDQGFSTSINTGVKIQNLTIENGTARIDFDDQLEFQVGGSCRVSAIRAQITETLKQFSTVQNVIISINGRTEDILQP